MLESGEFVDEGRHESCYGVGVACLGALPFKRTLPVEVLTVLILGEIRNIQPANQTTPSVWNGHMLNIVEHVQQNTGTVPKTSTTLLWSAITNDA